MSEITNPNVKPPSNLDALKAKIRALGAVTVQSGATEAEALTAAKKARELTDKYQIEMGPEKLKEIGVVRKYIRIERDEYLFYRQIWNALDAFCEIQTLINNKGEFRSQPQITLLGLETDIDLGIYLIESLNRFAITGAKDYVNLSKLTNKLDRANTQTIRRSYIIGCGTKIRDRLWSLKKERDTPIVLSSSTSLALLDKGTLIKEKMKTWYPKLGKAGPYKGASNLKAFAEGHKYGDKANLSRPLENNSTKK
jgi:Protein of unknown function (DUF2786)